MTKQPRKQQPIPTPKSQDGDGSPAKKKLSRMRKPEEMTLEAWQVALRRQFGREQKFKTKNVGGQRVFSEFEVTNPHSQRTYRVAIRGAGVGDNFCSCPDFTVNTLGTCKHIEFILGRLEGKAETRTQLADGFRPPYTEIHVRYGAKREVMFRRGSDCPEELARFAEGYFDTSGRLKDQAYIQFHRFLKRAMSYGHEICCYEDALRLIAEVRDQARLKGEVDRLFPRGIHSAAFKNLVKTQLYPYQREGAMFAAQAGRCLIADDMGLGKTIEAIAAAEILARTVGLERVLIVTPTSLKHQWQREIERFTERSATVVEGLIAQRDSLYAANSFYKITNYDVIARDLASIARWRPELVILDEAQRIKNWKTRTAQAVKRIESPYAFVLTGTPLENRLEELHSIVEFVDRFRLGPMFRFLHEHQHVDPTGRVVGYRNLSEISKTLAPILIRRSKDKVLKELPERMDKQMFVPMTPEQMRYHNENRELVGQIVQKWRRLGFLTEADQHRLMCGLQNMRMACNSTYLLDQETDFGVKADELLELLGEILEDPAAKAVVFSQWVRMHELLVPRLLQRKWDHVLFTGSVPGPHRKRLVQRFREDPACRLFLATDAGGVGLNLQHASTVINLDQPWNPAILEQRIGRVHRLGQRRPVRVVHLISKGTIEEGMLNVLSFKRSVFGGVLDGGQDEVFLGGTRLKQFMESVDKVTTAIPRPMPVEPPEPASVPPSVNGSRDRTADHPQPADTSPGEAPAPCVSPQEQMWSEVLTAGMTLLDKLTQTIAAAKTAPDSDRGPAGPAIAGLPAGLIAQESDGRPYLKLPLPAPEIVEKLAGLFAALRSST